MTFVWAILFAETSRSYDPFATVPKALLTLVVRGIFMDNPGILIHDLLDSSMIFHVVSFLLYISLCGYVVMNLLIGILVEIVHGATHRQKAMKDEKYLRDNLTEILESYDRNEDGHLNQEEFNWAMRDPDLQFLLKETGVNAKELKEFAGTLFKQQLDDFGIRIDKFLSVVLRMRGNNAVTVADFVAFREYLAERLNHIRILLSTGPSFVEQSSALGQSSSSLAAMTPSLGSRSPPDSEGPGLRHLVTPER